MTLELLIAIAALCNDSTVTAKYCKARMIDCVQASDKRDAEALAQCYWDSVFKGPWDPDKKETVDKPSK